MPKEKLNSEYFWITYQEADNLSSTESAHFHMHHKIFYMVSGKSNFFLDHNIYSLQEGDLVIIPAGSIHKTTNLENEMHARYEFDFIDTHLEHLKLSLPDKAMYDCLKPSVIMIPERKRIYVMDLIRRILKEQHQIDGYSQGFVNVYFEELMLIFLRCKESNKLVKAADSEHEEIQKAVNYIYYNYAKDLTLEDVAGFVHLNHSYLSKRFKQVTGFGFKDYLTNVRLCKAVELLLVTEQPITEIAQQCGFGNSNYFGDLFKRLKGMSPTDYRKTKSLA